MSMLRWGLRNGLRELYQSLQKNTILKNHVQLKSNILSGMSNTNYGIPNHITLKIERCLDGSLFKVEKCTFLNVFIAITHNDLVHNRCIVDYDSSQLSFC